MKLKNSIILLFLLIFQLSIINCQLSIAQAPAWLWAKSAGGYVGNDYAQSVATDVSGNVYVTGFFNSYEIKFGTYTLTNSNVLHPDIYLVKYNASGSVMWAIKEGGVGDDYAYSVTTDALGNVYIAGASNSPYILFGDIPVTNPNPGYYYSFLAKYNNIGSNQWVVCGTSKDGDDFANSVYTDAEGNAYVTGTFTSPYISFYTDTLYGNNPDTTEMFLVKYDKYGNYKWAITDKSNGTVYPASVTVDDSDIYVTGSFTGDSISFDKHFILNSSLDSFDIFLVKYDTSGNFQKLIGVGGVGNDFAKSVSTDANRNIYVAGYTDNTFTFNNIPLNNTPGNYDMFLLKYDGITGNPKWPANAKGTCSASSVSSDALGNTYVSGIYYSPTLIFPNDTLQIHNPQGDVFIAKFDCEGDELWATGAYGDVNDIDVQAVLDTSKNVYTTGFFGSHYLSFGTDTVHNTIPFPLRTYDNMFIAKLNHSCTVATFTQQPPVSDTICIHGSKTFTIKAIGDCDINYQWQVNNGDWANLSNGGTNPAYSGVTTPTLNISNAITSLPYRCVGINCKGTNTPSNTTILWVITKPFAGITSVTQYKNMGDSVTYSLSPHGAYSYTYQWMKDSIDIPGETKYYLKIKPIVCGDSGTYYCRIGDKCGDTINKIAILNILNCNHTISGYVKYDNKDSTAMTRDTTNQAIVKVYLLNSSNVKMDSVLTDCRGSYIFHKVPNGTYKLTGYTNKAWGGVNPVDALIVNRTYIGMYNLTDPLKRLAADVSNDKKINPTDALIINRRYIGMLTKYKIKDWLFSNPTVYIDGSDITKNIIALCAGDVNASFIPPVCIGSSSPFVDYNNRFSSYNSQTINTKISIDTVSAVPGDTILIPLRSMNFSPVSATGLRIATDTSVIKFIKCINFNSAFPINNEPLDTSIRGTIGFAWSSTDSSNLRIANAKLCDLQFVYVGGVSTLSFLGNSVVGDKDLATISTIFQPGYIHSKYSISGTLFSNANCGSKPVPNLILVLKDTNGNINTLIPPAITDSSGNFTFNVNGLHNIDSTKYRIVLLSGIGIADTTARTIPAWNNLSPLSLSLNNVIQDWVEKYGNADTTEFASAIDINENIYVACTNLNIGVITLIKYSPLGVRKWVVNYGDSINYYWVSDMKIDKNCFIYLSVIDNTGILTLKYDSTGYLIWTSNYSPSGVYNYYPYQSTLAVSDSGDVYVTGSLPYYYNPRSGNIFTTKYNSSNGEQLWVNTYGVLSSASMCIDKFANVYVANCNTLYKFSKAGTLLWSSVYNGGDSIQEIQFTYMKIDTNANLYISGYSRSNSNISAIIKFNKNGLLQWVKVHHYIGSTLSLILDNSANIIITELFNDGGYNNSYSPFYLKLTKYNSDGQELYQSNSIWDIDGSNLFFKANTQIDNDNNIYLCTSLSNDLYYGYLDNLTSLFKFLPDLNEEFEADYYVFTYEGSYDGGLFNVGLIISPSNNIYITNTQFKDDTTEVTTIKYSQCPENASMLRHIKDIQKPKKPVLSVKDPDVNVYPNPNDGSFTLEVSLPADGNVSLEAYNLIGENVLSEQHTMQKGVNKLNLKLNSTNKGIYFFNVVTATKTFNRKIIIE